MIDRNVAHPPLVFAARNPGRSHHVADCFTLGRAASVCGNLKRTARAVSRRASAAGTLAKLPLATLPHQDRSACGRGTPFEAPVARCTPALAKAGA